MVLVAAQLPLIPSEFNYEFTMALLGVEYLFNIRWNARSETWIMSLYDSDGEPLAQGMTIALDVAMGRRVTSEQFPDGIFLATDLSGSGVEASFDDLGVRVVVHFFSREDLA